jgi:hypothetical protein
MRTLLLGIVATLMPIWVGTPQAGDLRGIMVMIERQVAGLRDSDSRLLSSTISAQTRSLFPDDRTVLETFKKHFPGASGVRVTGFGAARPTELGFVQPVQISDQTGRLWRVLYAVVQDESRHWLINDFVAFEMPTTSA